MSFSKRLGQGLAVGASVIAIASPAQAQVRTFNIPAGNLKGALDAFAKQSGSQIIYRVNDVRSVHSPGVSGAFESQDALKAILNGTGFAPQVGASGAVAIVRAGGNVGGPLVGAAAASVPDNASQAASEPAILVTGSRIRRPNLDSPVPITSIGGEEFFETGKIAIGEVLNELPAMRTTVTQGNSFLSGGTTGANLLDLRGLGTDRTLVLQNGRRHVSAWAYGTAPDVNTIPADLIQRVDIVTGGSSAIYGSDAIAGVVNFVLKRDFEGLQLRAQGGMSKHNDGEQYLLSALAGTNFADGRGNVALSLEHSKQNAVYASNRPHNRNLAYFLPTDSDEPGLPNGSDGVPDTTLFKDIRYLQYSVNGSFFDFGNTDADGYPIGYLFQPDGSLVVQTGERLPGAFYEGGNGSNLREGKQVALFPELKRTSINLLGHFTVTDAFEPFIEAKFSRSDSLSSTISPFYTISNSFWGAWSDRELYSTDNPFLTDQARNLIRTTLGLAPGEESTFRFGRMFNEIGPRFEKGRRDTYRVVGGVRGTFNDDWQYEATINVAQVKSRSKIINDVNLQRYMLAIDAVREPTSGQIVCRSQIDPAAALPYDYPIDAAYAQAQLAHDVANCVPLNPFGEGNVSEAAREYVLADSSYGSKMNQHVLNAFVSGDSSKWFELPGGPIGFAVGGEYRFEKVRDQQNDDLKAGMNAYPGFADFKPPSFSVRELFGELRLPILADRPFFERLAVDAAVRVADYKGKTGTVVAWNAGLEWAPVRDLRFRFNRSRAVRAPNTNELYYPESQAFNLGLFTDPCSADEIGSGSPNRVANCREAGVPEGFEIFYGGGQFTYREGGNPDLKEETSDSLTIGAIIQPSIVPGLSLSVDYYDIEVSDVIETPSAQEIVNRCYDSPDLSNPFCSLFQRNPGPGLGPRGEVPGQIIGSSLLVGPLNYAALKVRGIDLEATYRRTLPGIGRISTRLLYTRAPRNDSFLDPQDPDYRDQNLLELGNPKHKLNWNVDLTRGPVTLGYQMRYFSKMSPGQIENILSVQGRPPQDADAYPFRYLESTFYHDVRASVKIANRFEIYGGVDNLTNKLAPLGINVLDRQGGIYDSMGRFFYAGAVARF